MLREEGQEHFTKPTNSLLGQQNVCFGHHKASMSDPKEICGMERKNCMRITKWFQLKRIRQEELAKIPANYIENILRN